MKKTKSIKISAQGRIYKNNDIRHLGFAAVESDVNSPIRRWLRLLSIRVALSAMATENMTVEG